MQNPPPPARSCYPTPSSSLPPPSSSLSPSSLSPYNLLQQVGVRSVVVHCGRVQPAGLWGAWQRVVPELVYQRLDALLLRLQPQVIAIPGLEGTVSYKPLESTYMCVLFCTPLYRIIYNVLYPTQLITYMFTSLLPIINVRFWGRGPLGNIQGLPYEKTHRGRPTIWKDSQG